MARVLTMTPDHEDEELVARARSGDRDAFGVLHGRYVRTIHGVLLAKVPPQAAADLVQDVFITAMERLPGLRADGAFGGWLVRIARNRATDWLRARRTVVELPEMPVAPRRTAEARQVLDAIRRLPEAYSETLMMRLAEGLTGPEIAARTGMTPGSVRVNLHRGMARLRAELNVDSSAGGIG